MAFELSFLLQRFGLFNVIMEYILVFTGHSSYNFIFTYYCVLVGRVAKLSLNRNKFILLQALAKLLSNASSRTNSLTKKYLLLSMRTQIRKFSQLDDFVVRWYTNLFAHEKLNNLLSWTF